MLYITYHYIFTFAKSSRFYSYVHVQVITIKKTMMKTVVSSVSACCDDVRMKEIET